MGRVNLPVSGASRPSADEQAALLEHEHALREAANETRTTIEKMADDLSATIRSFPNPRDLQVLVEEAFSAVSMKLAEDRLLAKRLHDLQRARLDLRALVDRLGIDRDAHYSTSPLLGWGVIAVVWLVEAAVNSGFLAESSSAGLVGGLSVALALSGLNVGTGLAIGAAWRWRNVSDMRQVRVANAVALGLVLIVVGFNGIVAQWRDVAGGSPSSGLSLESFLLWGLGLLSAGIAAVKFYRLDDPAPGYGAAHRRLARTARAFEQAEDALLRHALDQVRALPSRCRVKVGEGEELLRRMGRIRAQSLETLGAFDNRREDLGAELRHFVDDWRGANRRVRFTPAPSYFSTVPTLPDHDLDRTLPAAADEAIERATAQLMVLKDTAAGIEQQGEAYVARVTAKVVEHVARLVRLAESNDREIGTFEMAPLMSPAPDYER